MHFLDILKIIAYRHCYLREFWSSPWSSPWRLLGELLLGELEGLSGHDPVHPTPGVPAGAGVGLDGPTRPSNLNQILWIAALAQETEPLTVLLWTPLEELEKEVSNTVKRGFTLQFNRKLFKVLDHHFSFFLFFSWFLNNVQHEAWKQHYVKRLPNPNFSLLYGLNLPAQEKNSFYKEHYPCSMINLLIWRSCFMFFALELVKKRRWRRKQGSERNILKENLSTFEQEGFKNLHLFSSKSNHGYFFPQYFDFLMEQ